MAVGKGDTFVRDVKILRLICSRKLLHRRKLSDRLHPVDGLLRHFGEDAVDAHQLRALEKPERRDRQQKQYFTGGFVALGTAAALICGVLGVYVGKTLLKRHFKDMD